MLQLNESIHRIILLENACKCQDKIFVFNVCQESHCLDWGWCYGQRSANQYEWY